MDWQLFGAATGFIVLALGALAVSGVFGNAWLWPAVALIGLFPLIGLALRRLNATRALQTGELDIHTVPWEDPESLFAQAFTQQAVSAGFQRKGRYRTEAPGFETIIYCYSDGYTWAEITENGSIQLSTAFPDGAAVTTYFDQSLPAALADGFSVSTRTYDHRVRTQGSFKALYQSHRDRSAAFARRFGEPLDLPEAFSTALQFIRTEVEAPHRHELYLPFLQADIARLALLIGWAVVVGAAWLRGERPALEIALSMAALALLMQLVPLMLPVSPRAGSSVRVVLVIVAGGAVLTGVTGMWTTSLAMAAVAIMALSALLIIADVNQRTPA
ncbi:MAG: hypothetical protein ACFB51_09065 [Anaerolineae bacterium]